MKLALAEEAYQKQYLSEKGIQWRHFYGPDGPRPPPKLHMWPADRVGQIHKITSTHGFWFKILFYFNNFITSALGSVTELNTIAKVICH